jgi:uncharacterized membrane protein
MPASAAFCPGCGRRMIAVPAAVATTGFLKENVAAALAYVTFVPAIIFLRVRPFNHNRLVRFHSFQSIFFAIAVIVTGIALRVLFYMLSLIPRFGYLLASLAVLVVVLGFTILWLVVMVKALQGELFKLPVIGDFAEKA